MTQLKPQQIYVKKSVKDELPSENDWYGVFTDVITELYFDIDSKAWYYDSGRIDDVDNQTSILYWLKPQSSYVFSKEELEKLLTDCWCKAIDHLDDIQNKQDYSKTRKEYIKQLIP